MTFGEFNRLSLGLIRKKQKQKNSQDGPEEYDAKTCPS